MERLPQEVIEQDHRLEATSSKAAADLIRLRWHWTLDESNPERVNYRQYARDVGTHEGTIRRDAHAYELLAKDEHSSVLNVSEARARATSSMEKQAVTEAVAQARGVNYSTAERSRRIEVRHVREMAIDQAERKGTSIEEEAPKIAQMIVRHEEAEQRSQDERSERRGLRFIEVEGHLAGALRALAKAEKAAGLLWDEEEKELLHHTVDQVKRLIHRVDQRIAGVKEFNWDEELEEILKGA